MYFLNVTSRFSFLSFSLISLIFGVASGVDTVHLALADDGGAITIDQAVAATGSPIISAPSRTISSSIPSSVSPDSCAVPIQMVSNPAQVHAPCLEDSETLSPRIDLLSCKTVLDPTTNPSPQKSGLLVNFNAKMTNYLKCYYQGYILSDFNKFNQPSTQCSDGYKNVDPISGNPITVCNIVDGEGVSGGNSPVGNNHLSQMGLPGQVGLQDQSCGNVFSARSGAGTWEKAATAGLKAQAIKFVRRAIIREVYSTHNLKISADCQAMAEDYTNLNSCSRGLSGGLTSGTQVLPPQVYYGGVNFCTADSTNLKFSFPDPSSVTGGQLTVDLAQVMPKNAGCYLSISRENRTALFGSLMQCELGARVSALQAEYVGKETPKLNDVFSTVIRDAVNRGNDVGNAKLSRSAGESAGSDQFDAEYPGKILNFFQQANTDAGINQVLPTSDDPATSVGGL